MGRASSERGVPNIKIAPGVLLAAPLATLKAFAVFVMLQWMMPLIPVQSSNVHSVEYSAIDMSLTVWFISGGVYRYKGVPEQVYQAFLAAQPHPWTAMGRIIKQYDFDKLS